MSSGASMAGQFAGNMANTMLAGADGKGHAEGTTRSAVSDGTIVVRDQANQKQDTATLSRDTAHANDSISPIFNKEKEQQRLQTAQMIGEIGSQVADIARTQGEIYALKKAQEVKGPPPEGASEKARNAYIESLKATPEYKKAIADSDSGTGSSLQQGIQAATAAVQGLAGGDFKAALAGASAPYLAELIHKNTTTTGSGGKQVVNTAANLMAHAVVGAVIAQAQGNSALSGASGAALGEFIAQEMYPTDLSEEQKQTISALGTLAAGLAGGLANGSASGAIAGAQAGKNALENNALDDDELEKEREHGNVPVKIISLNPSNPDLLQEDGVTSKGGGDRVYSVSGPIKPLGIVSSFDANDIRFSQNTVSYNKTEQSKGMKYTYDDLVSSMKKDGWKGEPVDVIKMPDGKVTSMDNTRIRAAREAGIKVQANLRNFDEALPKDMLDSGRFGAAKTWGEAITGRINNQSGGFSKNNPNGSADIPRLTGNGK